MIWFYKSLRCYRPMLQDASEQRASYVCVAYLLPSHLVDPIPLQSSWSGYFPSTLHNNKITMANNLPNHALPYGANTPGLVYPLEEPAHIPNHEWYQTLQMFPPEDFGPGVYVNRTPKKTVLHMKDFIFGTPNRDTVVLGTDLALTSLGAAVEKGASVQRGVRQGPYEAYGPLQLAIHGMYEQLGMSTETPSAMALCQMHLSPEFNAISQRKLHESGPRVVLPTPNPINNSSVYQPICLQTMTILLEMLAIRDRAIGTCNTSYQLGIVTQSSGTIETSILPAELNHANATAWLFYTSSTNSAFHLGNWFGISRETQALDTGHSGQARLTLSTISSAINPIVMSIEHRQYYRLEQSPQDLNIPTSTQSSPMRSSKLLLHKGKRKRDDSSPCDSHKRRTAAPILEMRQMLPMDLSPEQIFEEHADKLSYNNLLRVALWYSNIDIHNQIDKHGKTKRKALSGVAKRIGVAIDHLAEVFDVPKEPLRKLFDEKRKDNEIVIRSKPKLECEVSALQRHRMELAIAEVWSASKTSGLSGASLDLRRTQNYGAVDTPGDLFWPDNFDSEVKSCWPTPQTPTKTPHDDQAGSLVPSDHQSHDLYHALFTELGAPSDHLYDSESDIFASNLQQSTSQYLYDPYLQSELQEWPKPLDNTGIEAQSDFLTPDSNTTDDLFYDAPEYIPNSETMPSVEYNPNQLVWAGSTLDLVDHLSGDLKWHSESPY